MSQHQVAWPAPLSAMSGLREKGTQADCERLSSPDIPDIDPIRLECPITQRVNDFAISAARSIFREFWFRTPITVRRRTSPTATASSRYPPALANPANATRVYHRRGCNTAWQYGEMACARSSIGTDSYNKHFHIDATTQNIFLPYPSFTSILRRNSDGPCYD